MAREPGDLGSEGRLGDSLLEQQRSRTALGGCVRV